MYKKILMAYNGTHEGRIALFECAEMASFVKAETHLLAVGTPSMAMFVEGFEGSIPDQGSAQAQKLMKNVLAEGLAALTNEVIRSRGTSQSANRWRKSADLRRS